MEDEDEEWPQRPASHHGIAMPRPARPELHCATTRWVSHAWCSRPDVFLSAEVWNRPEKGALAQWVLALEELAVKLKIAAAVLLRLLESPEHHAAALQATLRSALHHCAKVSQEEVLPSLRLFTLKSGAAPKEWRQALSRGVRPCKAPEARSAPDPFDAARWDDVLSSDRQRAVLRSLQAATSLGIPEADMLVQELAADFCRCERLARAARRAHAQVAKQSKPKAAQVERWRLAPFRCVAEVEREEARPHTERGPRSPRVLRPLDLQIGPVRSCDGLDASIARLVQVEPEPEAPAAPAAPRLRRPSSQATGRRPSGARHAPHRQR